MKANSSAGPQPGAARGEAEGVGQLGLRVPAPGQPGIGPRGLLGDGVGRRRRVGARVEQQLAVDRSHVQHQLLDLHRRPRASISSLALRTIGR